MGTRGRPPLPTAMKKKLGIREKARLKKHLRGGKEPMPKVGDPGMPPSIAKDRDARACWEYVAPLLAELKVLTESDSLALQGLCRSYSRAVQGDRAVQSYGVVIKNDWGTLQKNPACDISKNAWAEVRKFCQEFGLTPSSRSRVRVPEGGDAEDPKDSAEDFFFKTRDRKVAGSISPR